MVGGFNTDVRHRDRVLHVQTEVTSRPRRQITTLLFEGGTILHTHKTDLTGREDAEALRQRMETQHREFVEALKEGSFDAEVGLGREKSKARPEPAEGLRYFGDGVIGGGRLDEIVLAHLTSG